MADHILLNCSLPSCLTRSPVTPSRCATSLPNPCPGWPHKPLHALHFFFTGSLLLPGMCHAAPVISLALRVKAGCCLLFTSHSCANSLGKPPLAPYLEFSFHPHACPSPCFISTTLIIIWNYINFLFVSMFTCSLDDFSLDCELQERTWPCSFLYLRSPEEYLAPSKHSQDC